MDRRALPLQRYAMTVCTANVVTTVGLPTIAKLKILFPKFFLSRWGRVTSLGGSGFDGGKAPLL